MHFAQQAVWQVGDWDGFDGFGLGGFGMGLDGFGLGGFGLGGFGLGIYTGLGVGEFKLHVGQQLLTELENVAYLHIPSVSWQNVLKSVQFLLLNLMHILIEMAMLGLRPSDVTRIWLRELSSNVSIYTPPILIILFIVTYANDDLHAGFNDIIIFSKFDWKPVQQSYLLVSVQIFGVKKKHEVFSAVRLYDEDAHEFT